MGTLLHHCLAMLSPSSPPQERGQWRMTNGRSQKYLKMRTA